MIDLTKASVLGDTAAQYIDTVTYDMDGDGVGVWRIVSWGRSFGFEVDDLAEFVRLSVVRVVEAGGIPVRFAQTGPLLWEEQVQLSTTKDAIVDGVIADWQKTYGGKDIPFWEGLWFVTRDVLESAKRPPK